MNELTKKHCVPCEGGIPSLKGNELKNLKNKIKNDWKVIEEHHLEKEYNFKDFKQALDFTNKIGSLAEEENHHPDILLTWGKVKITIWTHAVNGLSENDFILAAKIDEL